MTDFTNTLQSARVQVRESVTPSLLIGGDMTTGHDIERGHKCYKCGRRTICTIEDGQCYGNEMCGTCLTDWAEEQVQREMDND